MPARNADVLQRLEAPHRNRRIARPALRRRAGERPMVLFSVVAATALAAMALVPIAGPAFASLDLPVDAAATRTADTARRPLSAVDLACRGQAWGGESAGCLDAIAAESGRPRAVRMIAAAAPVSTTPNIF